MGMKWGHSNYATYRCSTCKKLSRFRGATARCPYCDTGYLVRLDRAPNRRELVEHETHESLR
jgi:DNA-directed RNA polymerase subunit RPC12/RpoP